MTLEPETWQFNTDLGLLPLSELHFMSLVNNLSFVAFLRKFKRMYKEMKVERVGAWVLLGSEDAIEAFKG